MTNTATTAVRSLSCEGIRGQKKIVEKFGQRRLQRFLDLGSDGIVPRNFDALRSFEPQAHTRIRIYSFDHESVQPDLECIVTERLSMFVPNRSGLEIGDVENAIRI